MDGQSYGGFVGARPILSGNLDNSVDRVLHVRPARVGSVESAGADGAQGPLTSLALDRILAALPMEVDVCGDVYRGLARLARRDAAAQPMAAAFVCVDGLGSAELEFFSIASRLVPRPAVYVYGRRESSDWVRRAIQCGATGQATADVVESLGRLGALASSKGDHDRFAAATEVDVASDRAPATPVESAGDVWSVDLGDEPCVEGPVDVVDGQGDAVHEVGRAVDSAPPRVPWVNYDSTPTRKPPVRIVHGDDLSAAEDDTDVANDDNTVRASGGADSYDSGPLLTEEELRALVGDGEDTHPDGFGFGLDEPEGLSDGDGAQL